MSAEREQSYAESEAQRLRAQAAALEEHAHRKNGQQNIVASETDCVNIPLEELRAMIRYEVREALKFLMQAERRSLLARAEAIKREYE